MDNNKFAIINGIETSHKVIAIVDIIDYEVWGNSRDGFEVNNAFTRQRGAEIEVTCEVSGLPRLPGAKDAYREFPACGSFSVDRVAVSFVPSDKAIGAFFGLSAGKIEIEGDDTTFYVNLARNQKPVGEIRVVGYKGIGEAMINPVKV